MIRTGMKRQFTPATVLDVDLSDPGPIPEEAIAQAVALMRTGRLHRYGEYSDSEPHAARLEEEFADYVGSRFAVAVNSGGCAIYLGLKVSGVGHGDKVLVNAFNLAPVPGAIEHAGAQAILVEVNADHRINFADLRQKAQASGAKVLLLTHMRGHIADMQQVAALCEEFGLTLVEDCAHTMGAKWRGTFTGRFGAVGCFSTQTFKHINSGEGGILVTDDEDMAARAVIYSGSYMLYGQHSRAPSRSAFARWHKKTPNYSLRMSNLAACILRPQLKQMHIRGEQWNRIYRWLEARINAIDGLHVPAREPDEEFVASSIQFHVESLSPEKIEAFVDACTERGVAIKWFGREEPMGYTSQYHHWEYMTPQHLAHTTQVLSTTCDMRIPLSLSEQHCDAIAHIMREELARLT